MMTLKIVKWKIAWRKNRFCRRPCERCQVDSKLFSSPPILCRTNGVRKTWLPRQFQNGGLRSRSYKTNFSRLDPGHLRDWNLGELKSWMSTCYGGSQKTKLSGVSSFNFTLVKGRKKANNFYYHSMDFFSIFFGWEPTTWPANNCLQIMVCSCIIPSKSVFAANNILLMRSSNLALSLWSLLSEMEDRDCFP